MFWHNCWPGFGGSMPFSVPLFFVVFGVFVLWLVFGRRSYQPDWHPRAGASPENESPLEIAKRRFARGEISKEKFEEIKKNIA